MNNDPNIQRTGNGCINCLWKEINTADQTSVSVTGPVNTLDECEYCLWMVLKSFGSLAVLTTKYSVACTHH
jgi:hypothetical protein